MIDYRIQWPAQLVPPAHGSLGEERKTRMNPRYELRPLEEIDGLGGAKIEPRWTQYDWPSAPGLDKGYLESGRLAAFRIDRGNPLEGWSALDDLVGVVSGQQKIGTGGYWYLLPPVEMIRALVVIRMLGADERFEICVPPEYREILDSGNHAAAQISEAMRLTRSAADED
ncbi:hypothetical protein [Arthrobacter mobilis]|uniref:Uncharacterized protein n=1 Tax=Arthrobacter mobilis TaxID=2724944 RepID=A0A7X6K406_9MICC|nr:hypothetical protein [Arthrobacter mobilis]NKX54862.1 hypothetical protein [Arthrobacter mobilis]